MPLPYDPRNSRFKHHIGSPMPEYPARELTSTQDPIKWFRSNRLRRPENHSQFINACFWDLPRHEEHPRPSLQEILQGSGWRNMQTNSDRDVFCKDCAKEEILVRRGTCGHDDDDSHPGHRGIADQRSFERVYRYNRNDPNCGLVAFMQESASESPSVDGINSPPPKYMAYNVGENVRIPLIPSYAHRRKGCLDIADV